MANAAGGGLLAAETSLAHPAGAAGYSEVAEMRRIAGQMEQDNPRWIVLFGQYSREFVAFPRFAAPRGTVVAARYPEALPGRMRAVEGRALPRPAADAALPEGRGDARWQ